MSEKGNDMSSAGPGTASERITETIAGIWCRVLGRKSVPRDVSFLELGGDSLLFLAVLTAVQDEFGVFLDAGDVLDDLTVVGIARAVANAE